MGHTKTTVSAQWLKDNLDNPQVKIIDCRFLLSESDWGYQQYNHSHIENAYYFHLNQDFSSPIQPHGGRHPLPDNQVFADKLAQIGIIQNQTTVVIYDSSRFAFSARLWWLLRYLGHNQVFVLDGGWQQWQQLNYPVTNITPTLSQGYFSPQPQQDWLVNIDYVKQVLNSNSTVIIDARSGDRYRGEVEPIDPVAGSIPSAQNIFWQEMTTEEGKLKSVEELKAIWQPYQNYPEIIVYCGSGVTACVDILALNTINLCQCKLYSGGWSDWCSY
ncbi:MAG: sulfurtransferase [Cyanobacteria bacterium]|nr:sulfurtransferase [Cyanobacteria bacterium CG_2015-16_32_12]NCO78661.1 sulfurtransferase [Cyanobacteria bacterium CG_2015-22_32_23]NCQ04344.1 sulfurtransferase [Cyanobacteria bacterium CG_2015-09_32_10]NCQ42786.1 sulfurtransferase [Cyanobacteria bacterium CG_2015-04_32_10]NCS84785.1 sulfurtransferase [Cyanobacteria bacterium CG_2015-02_32_10]